MMLPISFRIIKEYPIIIGEIRVYLVWADSYGAKSSCVFIETPQLKLLVDPGAAAMQPSYPLSAQEREKFHRRALDTIIQFSQSVDTVFVSHYHYDHHTLPLVAKKLYSGKELWIKDPNRWINHSQWERARLFLNQLYETSGGEDLNVIYVRPQNYLTFEDPLKTLPIASAKDYGDYQTRKNQLLAKGKAWFEKMASIWQKERWVSEFKLGDMKVSFADGSFFKKGSTTVRFTEPMFHGIEYDRIGWVVGFTAEHKGNKVIYASDLQGPHIEDYAQWIIEENPDILILDGPATYLFGYMINRINLQRAIDNICSILNNTDSKVIIYDHHLLRDFRYKERIAQAYDAARVQGKTFLSAAEWLGYEPLILKLKREEHV